MANEFGTQRLWLEVFKFFSPRELATLDTVCSLWKSCSRHDEVWAQHVEVPDFSHCLREVCKEQLFRPHFIAHIDCEGFRIYFPLERKLKKRSVPEGMVMSDFASWVSIPGYVFFCGAAEASAVCYLINLRTNVAKEIPVGGVARLQAGLVYFAGKVYVFGGLNPLSDGRANDLYLAECEEFTVATKQWVSLPNLSVPRGGFVPARLKSSIYIAGGFNADRSVEVFSLVSKTFQTSAILRLSFEDYETTAFALGNTLVIMSEYHVRQYDVGTGQVLRETDLEAEKPFSPAGAIVCNGKAYFVFEDEFWKLKQNFVAKWIELER